MDIKGLTALLASGNVITYILGRLAGRKKIKADLEGKRLENLESAIEIYEKVHDELKEQLEILSDRCAKLSAQIEDLKVENQTLRSEIHTLTQKLKSKNN